MTTFYKNTSYKTTDSYDIKASVQSKGLTNNRNFIVPAYSRPLNGMETDGYRGTNYTSARPIKHWRKQLNPRTDSNGNATSGVNGRRAGIVGYMDIPGGSTILGTTSSCNSASLCTKTATMLTDNILRPVDDQWFSFLDSSGVCHYNEVNGNIETNVKYSANTNLSKTYYPDRKGYLQSRCLLYDQKLSGTARVPGVAYFINGIVQTPNGTNKVEQRMTENCLNCPNTTQSNSAITIYKPNNAQYATQGAVDSSSRITRLKYNTIAKGGYQAVSAAYGTNGAQANSTYNGSDNSPYFLKNKYNNAPCTFTRVGSKTSACFKAMYIR